MYRGLAFGCHTGVEMNAWCGENAIYASQALFLQLDLYTLEKP
jgi:hypothetical protein